MKIEISDIDFQRLQSIAEPLVDTPATVISRILDFYESSKEFDEINDEKSKELIGLSIEALPLTHTKILMAKFNEKQPDRLTWDGLLRLAFQEAFQKAKTFDELKSAAGANMVDYEKTDHGYKYLPSLELSYQGVSADDALKIIRRLSEYLWQDCEFKFEYRDKAEAYMPGKTAYCHIGAGLMKFSWNNPGVQ